MASREVRIAVVGLGTVGRWLVGALHAHRSRLESRYGFRPKLVAVATARDSFVSHADGLDPLAILDERLEALPGVRYPTALDGPGATEADVLVEVTASPAESGEPASRICARRSGRDRGGDLEQVAGRIAWPGARRAGASAGRPLPGREDPLDAARWGALRDFR